MSYTNSGPEDESITSESDNEYVLSGSEDEGDADALDVLNNFVSGLDTSAKRKTVGSDGRDVEPVGEVRVPKKPRIVQERVEGGIESEFGIRPAGPSQLSLNDLLKPLASDKGMLSSLKKSIGFMQNSSASKNQLLSTPLPTRTQERVDRQAAYEQTKEEVGKWGETMKQIREAEHLSFPLQSQSAVKVSNLGLAAKFKPSTELESSVDRLLKAANLREEDINKTEDLLMKDLTVEEVAARRAELRRLRELAFRADAKAKRVAKIKSKTYHRIRKRQQAKLMTKLGEAGEEVAHEKRLRVEIDRAKERATLKHKTMGKWAQAMQARNELDEDQQRSINEMLERGERLRRQIQGALSGSEDDSESESDDALDDKIGEEAREMCIKAKAFDELENIRTESHDYESSGDSEDKKAKGVFEMKFMKDGEARKNQALDHEIDDFRKELGEITKHGDGEAGKGDGEEATPIEKVNGRMVFQPGPQANLLQQQQQQLLPPPSAISETSTLRSHDSLQSPVREAASKSDASHSMSVPTDVSPDASSVPLFKTAPLSMEEQNPWLALPELASSSSKRSRRKNELIVGKANTAAQKSAAVMQKQLKKSAEERELKNNDAVLEISTKNELMLGSSGVRESEATSRDASSTSNATTQRGILSKNKKKKLLRANKATKVGDSSSKVPPSGNIPALVTRQELGEDSSAHSEIEEQESMLFGNRSKALQQRELVARAFMGDDVMREFEEAKEKEMEADAPKEIDTTLPGWGSWGGAGTKKAKAKPHLIRKLAGIDPRSRKDYEKTNVIICEKRDKKAAKYAIQDLPYPFTSKAQYDAAMNTPLGTEWNTRLSFQHGTLPRVVKKMGTVIDPLQKS